MIIRRDAMGETLSETARWGYPEEPMRIEEEWHWIELCNEPCFNPSSCTTIAYAFQFVDDAIDDDEVVLQTRYAVVPAMTSHTSIDYRNALQGDQWKVWIAFHFCPAPNPSLFYYITIVVQLVTRKNSRETLSGVFLGTVQPPDDNAGHHGSVCTWNEWICIHEQSAGN